MALRFSTALRAAQLNQISTIAGGAALLQFWSAPIPATGGTPSGSKLAELTCSVTFAATTSTAVLTLNPITSAAALPAAGTGTDCKFARITTSGGTFVMDMDVGTAGADLNMSTITFVAGATISVTSFTITAGNP